MIHILNFESRIIDFFSNNDSNITVAEHTHNIEEDLETLVLTVGINRSENFRQRNRVLIEASDGSYREFIIQDTEDDLIEGETQVTCVASYLEDLSKAKPMPPQKYDNMTLDEMLFDVLRATGWEVGYVDYMGIKDRSWTAYATPYEVLVMLKTTFKHEYEFLIEIEGNRVKRRVVNCVEPTNLFNGREIEYGKDLIGMTRTIDNSEVVTAYIGLGPEDDAGNREVVEVVDNDAQEDFGLPENYLWGIYEPESENDSMTKERLTTLTRTALNKAKVAAVSYEVEAVDIHKQFPHELIQIGDKVRIKNRDMKPALYADARVLEIVTNLIDGTQTYKFGQVKEYNENTLRSYFNSLRAEFTKKLNDGINNLDTIISETVEGLDIFERKIFKGDTPPENPVNDALWYDTSNPDVAILRRYWNGEWIAATPEDVEQLGGMTREQILYNELTNTFSNLAIQHSKLLNDVYAIINNEYLVDNDIKNDVQAKLDDTITVYQQISTNLDSMTEETATIGKLMDTQALFLTYRQKLQTLYIAVENAQIAINERFKLLQSQYTQEKFNNAMQEVAAAINGAFDEETGQLIANIPNQEMLDDMRTTIENSMNDMSQENTRKIQELQEGITQTNQRITSTNEELSAGISSVTKKVEGLQVGGKNLIRNSEEFTDYIILANVEKAGTYSLGFEPHFTEEIPDKFGLFYGGGVYGQTIDYLKNDKPRITHTFEVSEDRIGKDIRLFFGGTYSTHLNFANKGYVGKIKLEYGNFATDWTPAPEDTQAQITKAQQEATDAAKAYADAQDNLKLVTAQAYADGVVDAEEQRAIQDAQTKLDQAKAYAETKATEAQNAANAYANNKASQAKEDATNAAKAYADAQDNLKAIETKAYADGIVDAEEQRAIDDAKAKLAQAKTYAEQKATEAKNAAITDTTNQLEPIKATVQTQSADIKVLKEGIKLKADSSEVTKIYDNYLTPLQTQVNQQKATLDILPSQIASKVSQSTYNADMNNVIGRLNTADSERSQLGNQIKDRVTINEYNNMKIGTENLLLNSLYQDKSTSSSLTHAFFRYYLTTPLKVGKTYTFTCNFNTTDANQSGRTSVRGYTPDNGLIDVDIIESKIKVTFVAKVESSTFLVYKDIAGTSPHTLNVNITNAMLVEGNKIGDYQQASEDTDQRLTTMQTSIEQNGQDIIQRATKEEFNASKQTLSRVLAEIVTNTTTGITLTYDENGGIQNFTLGPNGTLIDTKKLTIEAGDVSLKNGVFTVNKVNTKNVTIPRDDGGVPTIINGIDKQISTVTGMDPMFSSTFGVGNNIFITEIFRSGTWYGVFKRFANSSQQDFARVNAYYFQHTRRYLKFNYLVHVGTDADDKGNTPTGIYMRVQEFGRDVGNRMDYLNLVPTSQGGTSGIVEVNHVFDLGPPTGEPRAFYIHVKPNGEGIVGGSTGTDPRTWSKYSVCKFAFRPFELYG
ncbi:hypothetical protein KRP69_01505 [Mammaliicoccus sciuri]|uniref:phage tail spike protein n=1 Tax=Mammaliicoccus sciuri TaxID=1296 RepID=UPI001D0D5492|nr:phage tail spike protein [Mammaliicoccus sciuri]MCC2087880.1 hypothetical protein [Mammaliicoccus sciuri]